MAEHAPSSVAPTRLNPAAMSIEDAARVLGKLGGRPVTSEMLESDLEAGAPRNGDGSINLVHYAAWLVDQMRGS